MCRHELVDNFPWVSLQNWDALAEIGRARDKLRTSDNNTYNRPGTHVPGILAEAAYAQREGVAFRIDVNPHGGDDGIDTSDNAQVKSAVHEWDNPVLRQEPERLAKLLRANPSKFVLYSVDMDRKRVAYVGETSVQSVLDAPLIQWTEMYPPQHSLHWTQLDVLPRRVSYCKHCGEPWGWCAFQSKLETAKLLEQYGLARNLRYG